MTKRRDTGLRTDGHGSWYVYTDAEASGGLGVPGPIFSIAIPHGLPAVILRALSGPDAPAAIDPLGVARYGPATACGGRVRGGGGRILVAGPPEIVAKHKTSHTGRFLKPLLENST